jgi:hypothetical protein
MKRTALALTLIIVIIFSTVVGVQFAKLVKANPEPSIIKYLIIISIESPANKTYNTNTILLNISAFTQMGPDFTPLTAVRYSIDGGPFVYFADPVETNVANDSAWLDLPEGSHTIVAKARTLNAQAGIDSQVCANVTFTIDTTPPIISILSPANTSYAAIYDPYITVPLSFETNASLSWVGYSLDGGSNITVSQNGTLIEIRHESRSLTLYANDTAGNWATPQTVYYSIAFNLGIPSEPFPTLLVVATSVAVVAVVAVGVLVYFKKRNHKTEITNRVK